MTQEKQHDSYQAFSEAARLIDKYLPDRSRCFEVASSATALLTAAYLDKHNHPKDDQLAALLWLLPQEAARPLTPAYLEPVIGELKSLWPKVLQALDNRSSPAVDFACAGISDKAAAIACAFLFINNELGHRQVFESRNRLQTELSTTRFLENLERVARVLAAKAEGLDGQRLMDSIAESKKDASVDEPDAIWRIRVRPDADVELPAELLLHLQRFIMSFWLWIGRFPDEHPESATTLFVRIQYKKDPGSIDRMMTSLAVHFSRILEIEKVWANPQFKDITWTRSSILSWSRGLVLSGRLQRLLSNRAADPLAEFLQNPEPTAAGQKKQLMELRGH